MKPVKVVVVGSSNTDMVIQTPKIPSPGETVLGGDYVIASGGKGANQAVASARLGAETILVARVGHDIFGERAVASIGAAGVNTKYIIHDPSAPSGIALIAVDSTGQNSIVVAPGANANLSPDDVNNAMDAFQECDVVALQFEVPLVTVERAIALAKELDKIVILNPAPARSFPDYFLRGVDVLIPNEVEASMILGREINASFTHADAANALREKGVDAVVITLGAEGAVAASHDRIQEIPPRRVKAVDTTAAGDCFTGALATALGEGKDLGQAVYFANAAAALSVTRLGAQTSMPTRQEVDSFIKKR